MKRIILTIGMLIALASVAQADCHWEMILTPDGDVVNVYVCD